MMRATMATPPRVTHRPYGRTAEGVEVDLYELRTGRGLSAEVSTFGGVVTSLRVPDRAGRLGDVVLGFPSLDGYLATSTYFGALIGRYGNRIAGGRFALGGKTYALARNNGANHLHGGLRGFDKVVWRARPLEEAGRAGVVLSYLSRDGEEGYPGNLEAGKQAPYQGYLFRVLAAQGADAPGGAKSYVRAGKMVDGFGLIGWPASFGASGIMSFIVNQAGVVFQKDLGPDTAARAAAIRAGSSGQPSFLSSEAG
jgi:hypothetical protein